MGLCWSWELRTTRILAWPALGWFSVFLFAPVTLVVALSFARRGLYGGVEWEFTWMNYLRLMDPVIGMILLRSLVFAVAAGGLCALTGLMVAWAMAVGSPQRRGILFTLIAVPFLTNLVIRVYALKDFVGFRGPVQGLLGWFGVEVDPFFFTANPFLVAYGMFSTYLPFAILPLFAAFEKFDFSLIEAARDLGAGAWAQFRHVVLPVMAKPLGAAMALVAIPCLGEFIIPDLLGGARTMLLGNLITEKFLKARDWPAGSALAVGAMGLFFLGALAVRLSRRSHV